MLGDALEVGFESRLSSTALHAATFFLEELMEMLSNFLGVRPEQNMRELPYPISSFRKLKERPA